MSSNTTTRDWAGTARRALPDDGTAGTLVGRVFDPAVAGPSPVLVTEEGVFDLSARFATVAALADEADPAAAAREAASGAPRLGSFEEIEFIVHRQTTSGNVVMNERTDRFRTGDRWIDLPVAGLFELDDAGKIVLWRDYFDMATYTNQM